MRAADVIVDAFEGSAASAAAPRAMCRRRSPEINVTGVRSKVCLNLATPAFALFLLAGSAACDRQREVESSLGVIASAEVTWRLGGSGETGGVLLTAAPAAGAVGPNGLTAIVDRYSALVLLFDEGGRLLRRIGGPGGGPGEFRRPDRVGFTPDSLLWVGDAGAARISWFAIDGTFIKSTTRAWEPVPGSPWSARASAVVGGTNILGVASAASSADGDVRYPVVVWPADDTMTLVAWVDQGPPTGRRVQTSMGDFVGGPQPIQALPIIAPASGANWFFILDRTPAESPVASMLIRRFAGDGSELARTTIPYRPVRVDDGVRAGLRAQASAFATAYMSKAGPGSGAITVEQVLDATWIPRTLPPAVQAFGDTMGFWIRREQTTSGRWERYDLRGRLLARLNLAQNFHGLAADPTTIAGWQLDSLDVPVLTRYRVHAASGELSAISSTGNDLLDGIPSLRPIHVWSLREPIAFRGGVVFDDSTAALWVADGRAWLFATSTSEPMPIDHSHAPLLFATTQSGSRAQRIVVSRTSPNVWRLASRGALEHTGVQCEPLVSTMAMLALGGRVLAARPVARGRRQEIVSIRLPAAGRCATEGFVASMQCEGTMPYLAASGLRDVAAVATCATPESPLFAVTASKSGTRIIQILDSTPHDDSQTASIRTWHVLPLMRFEGGYMRMLVDIRSLERRIQLWNAAGRFVRTSVIHDPVGVVGSSPSGKLLIGMYGAAVVLFEVGHTDDLPMASGFLGPAPAIASTSDTHSS